MWEGTTWLGWIVADEEDKGDLEDLGVQVGEYNHEKGSFEGCTATTEVLEKLDPHWGRFYWGMNPIDRKEVLR